MSRLQGEEIGGRHALRHAAQEAVGAHGVAGDAQQQRRVLRSPGRQVSHGAVQGPLQATEALALAAQRDPGRLALGPVVVDDLAVLGLEQPADLLVALVRALVGGVLLVVPARVDEIPEGERLAPAVGQRARKQARRDA